MSELVLYPLREREHLALMCDPQVTVFDFSHVSSSILIALQYCPLRYV